MSREITNDDLWSCIRGNNMMQLPDDMLEELALRHETGELKELFASQVTAKAARQVQAMRKQMWRH